MITASNPNTLKSAAFFGMGLALLVLFYYAFTHPGYFTSQTYIGGLILLELVAVAIWKYRKVFFPVILVVFLLAGTSLPGKGAWTTARWAFLAVGALVGFLMLLKDRRHHFNLLHVLALFAVFTAAVSVMVSEYGGFAMLKVLSLLLLFLYAGTGVPLVVHGSGSRFFNGLLVGCEILTAAVAFSYLILGSELLGNPNSLGAVSGVVAAPILLWGALASNDVTLQRRRFLLYALAMYLVYHSHARAAILAVAVSSSVLCLALRRYRTLVIGVSLVSVLLAAAAIVRPETVFEAVSDVSDQVVYKGHAEGGIFSSRRSPWQDAMDSIRSNFWFGTGFGTNTMTDGSGKRMITNLTSSSELSTEYGSSYLKIATWVGMVGVLPFLALLALLGFRVVQTVVWMAKTRDPSHPAIPVAMVVLGSMLHAAFEDWMFAPGYYLCVFFWCMAFVLVDFFPSGGLRGERASL